MKISVDDVPNLDNDGKYSLFYSQACHSGHFYYYDCIAESWVNTPKKGGFAAIMNSGYGYGGIVDFDGPDNRYAREFYDALFSPDEKISRIGKANQDSKQDNYYRIDEDKMYHVYYDTLLFGDPYVAIKGAEDAQAQFNWNPKYPKTSESITFDDISLGYIIYREWDFDDGSNSNEENPNHTYTNPGIYDVKLTVWDTHGESSTINHEIEIRDQWTPHAIASPEYYSGNLYSIQFDAIESWDPDGSIINYEWDFNDGSYSNEISPLHDFLIAGWYEVKLTVIDNDNNIDIVTCNIGIGTQMPPDTPQIPIGPNYGILSYQYTFSTQTSDNENDLIQYAWDWDDSSSIEWSDYITAESVCFINHTYYKSGNFQIRVKARDIHGAESGWSEPLNIDVDDGDDPVVIIRKPVNALYIANNEIINFNKPFIIGNIDIELDTLDTSGIERIDIYIDDELADTINSKPYTWNWNDRYILKFKHTINIIVYDTTGRYTSKVIEVFKLF
jgi:hypothetical protein